MALTDEKLYWSVYDRDSKTESIRRADLDGNNEEDVMVGIARWVKSMAVDAVNQKIYWASYDYETRTGQIHRANLDGTNVETLIQTDVLRVPTDIDVDAVSGKLYWIESIETPFGATGRIRWANLDGTEAKNLIDDGLQAPCGIDVDAINEKIYWADLGANKIQRSNLDGTNVEDLVTTGLQIPLGLVVDEIHSKMYWTNWSSGIVERANLNGAGVEKVAETGIEPKNSDDIGLRGISIDTIGEKIYWTDGLSVFRANLNGTDSETIVGGTQINGIFVDESRGKLYWTNNGLQLKVERANLDGSDREDIISHPIDLALAVSNLMRGVTVDVVNEQVYWIDLWPASVGIKKIWSMLIRDLPEPRMITLNQPRPIERLPIQNDEQSVNPHIKQSVTWGKLRRNALLQNYPNPFNPATWIPYELAVEADVYLEIYTTTGQLVRRLEPGRQTAGSYLKPYQAAYWDGKSEAGVPVSSGIYFYTIRAGDFVSTRRMVIVK